MQVIALVNPNRLYGVFLTGNKNHANVERVSVAATEKNLCYPAILYTNLNDLKAVEGGRLKALDIAVAVILPRIVSVTGPAQCNSPGRLDEAMRESNLGVVEVHSPILVDVSDGIKDGSTVLNVVIEVMEYRERVTLNRVNLRGHMSIVPLQISKIK